MNCFSIGIVGAGIGGLAAAGFLAKDGHDVTVFDQFETPEPVGSGLVVQPVGQMVLDALGVLDRAKRYGARINRMVGVEADSGREVLNVAYGKGKVDKFGLAMHRASLFDCVLFAAQQAEARILQGRKVVGTRLSDGKRFLQIADGGESAPFDLIIDASGASSALSSLVAKPLPFGALWGVVDARPSVAAPVDVLAQCYRKSSTMVGILPIGTLPGGTTAKSAVFWSLRNADFADWQRNTFETWQDRAETLWPTFQPMSQQLKNHADLTMARYTHGTLRNPVQDQLVFIGDAAHRTSPQLGQGANMALLDAMALADSLRYLTLPAALEEYARIRRWHVRIYQWISRFFTPFYQSDSATLPLFRDYVLAPISDWPIVRGILQRMVRGELVSLDQLANSPRSKSR